jgi:hypothetical protein
MKEFSRETLIKLKSVISSGVEKPAFRFAELNQTFPRQVLGVKRRKNAARSLP